MDKSESQKLQGDSVMESPHTSASFTLSSTQRIWEKNLLLLAGKGEKKPV